MIAEKISRPFNRLAKLVWEKPLAVLLVSLFVTALSVWQTTKLHLDASLDSLLPSDDPVILNIKEVEKIYGNLASLKILLKSQNKKNLVQFVEKIIPEIKKDPEIRYVEYTKPLQFFQKNILLYTDLPDLHKLYARLKRKFDYERRKNSPLLFNLGNYENDPGFYIGDLLKKYKDKYNISDTGKKEDKYFYKEIKEGDKKSHAMIIAVKPHKGAIDVAFGRYISTKVQNIVSSAVISPDEKEISIQYTGQYLERPESFELLGQDLARVTLFSVIGLFIVLVAALRGLKAIGLIFISLASGIIWTLGVTNIFIGQLNLLTTFFVAILVGLGIDFGIHFFIRFKEERLSGNNSKESFFQMYTKTGVASAVSALTTSVAFYGLSFSGFRAFKEFGYIAGTGILLIMLSYLTIFSSLLVLSEKRKPLDFSTGWLRLRLPNFLIHYPVLRSGFFILFTAISFWGALQLKFNYDFSRIMATEGLPSYQVDREVSTLFHKDFDTPTIILPRDKQHEKEIIKLIETKKKENANDFTIRRFISIDSFVPKNQQQKINVIRKIKQLVKINKKYSRLLSRKIDEKKYVSLRNFENLLATKPIGFQDLPISIRRNFTTKKDNAQKQTILLWPQFDLNDGKEAIRYGDTLNNLEIKGEKLKIASEHLIFAEILNTIGREGPYILLYSLVAVFLLVLFDFRKLHRALLVLSPVIFGLIWMAGSMGIIGVEVDFINVIIFPIIIGIGIDSGVHLYHRYRESGDIYKAVKNTGEAILLSALTTAVGFGALTQAHNLTIRGLGYAAIIGILCTVLAAVLFLPAKILIGQKIKSTRSKQSPKPIKGTNNKNEQ